MPAAGGGRPARSQPCCSRWWRCTRCAAWRSTPATLAEGLLALPAGRAIPAGNAVRAGRLAPGDMSEVPGAGRVSCGGCYTS